MVTYKQLVQSLFVEDTLQDVLKAQSSRTTLHYIIQNNGARDFVLPLAWVVLQCVGKLMLRHRSCTMCMKCTVLSICKCIHKAVKAEPIITFGVPPQRYKYGCTYNNP